MASEAQDGLPSCPGDNQKSCHVRITKCPFGTFSRCPKIVSISMETLTPPPALHLPFESCTGFPVTVLVKPGMKINLLTGKYLKN